MDTNSVCRACLENIKESGYRVSLFDNGYDSWFETCTSIQVLRDDVYPKVLCSVCCRFLEQLKKFQEKCKQSKSLWDSYLNALQNKDAISKPAEGKEEIRSESSLSTSYSVPDANDCETSVDVNGDDRKVIISTFPQASVTEEECKTFSWMYDTDRKFENLKDSETFKGLCNMCLTEFDKKVKLIRHLSSCTQRQKKSLTEELKNKTAYARGHEKRTSFSKTCNNCNKSYCYKSSWIKHINNCKINTKKKIVLPKKETVLQDLLICGICSKQFDDMNQVNSHLGQHESSGNMLCELCDFSAIDFADLLQHRYSHGPSDQRHKIMCFKCDYTFKKRDRLEFHFRLAHLKKTPGVCKQCSRQFNNYSHYTAHLVKHTGRRFTCETCQKTFTYEKSLLKHQSVHGARRFMCHMCGFSSRRANGLRSHINHLHSEQDPILCPDCGKVFKNKATLRDHSLREHTEKSHVCAVCSKQFRREADMIVHQKWHLDTKPYTCDICGLCYKAKAHLVAHMRNHTGQRPYKCDVCGMAFIVSAGLKRHKLTHTGIKAHRCDVCDKRYVTKNNLKIHMRKHNVKNG